MAVADGDTVTVVKDMGLVATVFDERTLSALQGNLAIGHTRYSTHGSSDWAGAQPVYRPVGRAGFALGHNGNLTNTGALAEKAGMLPGSIATDSDVVAELLMQAFPETEDLSTALQAVLPILEGAFSFVLLSSERLFGVRDPYGFRPLCLGRLGPADAPEGWVLASETPARGCATWSHACASSSSPTSPDRTAGSTAGKSMRCGAAWASCWPCRHRPRRTW